MGNFTSGVKISGLIQSFNIGRGKFYILAVKASGLIGNFNKINYNCERVHTWAVKTQNFYRVDHSCEKFHNPGVKESATETYPMCENIKFNSNFSRF